MKTAEPKRILVFSTAYFPFVGGAEVAVKKITEKIGPDFSFDLITAKMKKELPSSERIGLVNVYRVGNGGRLDKILLPFRGAFKALELSRKHKYFALWGIMVTFGSLSAFIFNILKALVCEKRVPIVLTLQEGDSEEHLRYRWGGLIHFSWKFALKRTDILTGISNFLLNRAEKYNYQGQKFLVPNGVDTELFSRKIEEVEKNNLIKKLDKKTDDIYLVTTGRLVKKNGTEDIIKSLVYLPKNISLVVIGSGELGHDLQELVNRLGLVGRVKFVGFVPYEDIPKYLSVCDVFIRPSLSEGFGNSFIEAMAAGIPVIATPVGGIPDFLHDKNTGLFCSVGNPQSISKLVSLLLDDKELASQITNNAKKMAVEKYDWQYIAKQMRDVFDRLV